MSLTYGGSPERDAKHTDSLAQLTKRYDDRLEKLRKAGLRLDVREGAVKTLKTGSKAVVPGKPAESELITRINATDSDRMPPPKSNHTLKDAEKNLLKRWIVEGAEYQRHWSFVSPKRPPIPEVKNKVWVRNPVDAFILARLEKEGLQPAPEADTAAATARSPRATTPCIT